MSVTVYVEVTNTLAVDFLTGFQRHTREIITRLPGPDAGGPVQFVPVTWCRALRAHRRLTDAETARLHAHHVPAARRPPAASPSRLRRLVGSLAAVGPVDRLRHEFAKRRDPAGPLPALEALRVPWERGSALFDLEAAWEDPSSRMTLLPWLRDRGVTTTALIADVMPVLFPHWFRTGTCERFAPFLEAHLRHSASFVFISECTRADTVEWAAREGVDHDIGGVTVTLGADVPGSGRPEPPEGLRDRRYLLCVATLEPRKNQALALDVYDRLRDRHPDLALVFVGRAGWHVEHLVERIRSHPDFGDRVRWDGGAADDDLATLYRHAFVALVPSWYEGYGVPLIEAMAAGVPAIASTGGAVPEAAAGIAQLAAPDDLDGWVAAVARHLDDAAFHDEARRATAAFVPPTWAGAADAIDRWMTELVSR